MKQISKNIRGRALMVVLYHTRVVLVKVAIGIYHALIIILVILDFLTVIL